MSDIQPVFIGGAGRSGTTLVVDMLGLHARLSPIYETDFVLQLGRLLFTEPRPAVNDIRPHVLHCMDEWTKPLPIRPHNKRGHEQFHHGPHYILFDRPFALERTEELLLEMGTGRYRQALRHFIAKLFEEHSRLDGKPRWLNKTPAYVLHLPLLKAVFPTMRFIHCVRDGRDAACSAVTRPWGPSDYQKAAAWWVNNVQPGIEFGRQHPEQYLEVRFEDLVLGPVETLGRMLTWLGEEGDPGEVLRHYQDGRVRLDPARIGEWERTFSAEDKRAFQESAGAVLAHFGY